MFKITGLGTFLAAVILGFAGFGATSIITSEEAVARGPAGYRGQARRIGRRTARRVIRRHYLFLGGVRRAYVTGLPVGCPSVIYAGVRHYYCGSVYYRPYYQGNTVVYIIVE